MPPPRLFPSYVLKSTLALFGVACVALLLVVTFVNPQVPQVPQVSNGPSPSLANASCTDLLIVDLVDSPGKQLAHVSGISGIVYQDPWSLLGLSQPSGGILPDLHTLKAKFFSKVKEAQDVGAGITAFQSLYHAYLAVLNATAFLLRDQQYQQLKLMRLPLQTNTIASEDVQRVIKHLEKERNAFADQSARMEQWGSFLKSDLHASKRRIEELEGSLGLAEEHARCAPPWFGAWVDFLKQRCIQGNDKRVGSAELHEAFVAYLMAQSSKSPLVALVGGHQGNDLQGEVPTHKMFRELLEHLNYEYDQIYINGTNKRGFRGIALKPSLPTS